MINGRNVDASVYFDVRSQCHLTQNYNLFSTTLTTRSSAERLCR